MKKVYLLALITTALLLTGCGGGTSLTPPSSNDNSQNQGSNDGGNNGGGTGSHIHGNNPGYVDPGIKKIKQNNIPHPNKRYSKIPIKPHIPPLPPKL